MATPRKTLPIGKTYWHLTVVGKSDPVQNGKGHLRSASVFKCDCGNICIAINSDVERGKKKSCGICRPGHTIHGGCGSRIYKIWMSMNHRCSPTCGERNYKDYYGRGIRVCDQWKASFTAFRDWSISVGYSDGLSIDRINPNGNYEPDNCRFIPLEKQQLNKRNNVVITFQGKNQTAAEWGRELGINPKLIRLRISKGMSEKDALSKNNLKSKTKKENNK